MNKLLKITIILIITILVFGLLNFNFVYAESEVQPESGAEQRTTQDVQKSKKEKQKAQQEEAKWEKWNPNNSEQTEIDQEIQDKANIIVTVIRNIGIVISVVALMVIGIREMTASVEEKSVIKQAMPGYILGVVMVIAVTTIPSIIYSLVKSK